MAEESHLVFREGTDADLLLVDPLCAQKDSLCDHLNEHFELLPHFLAPFLVPNFLQIQILQFLGTEQFLGQLLHVFLSCLSDLSRIFVFDLKGVQVIFFALKAKETAELWDDLGNTLLLPVSEG